MKSWEKIISEAKSKREKELEDRVSELGDIPSSLKKEKDKKKENTKKSEYTKYLKKQLEFKKQKYEEQKRRQLENIKEKEKAEKERSKKETLSKIKKSLSDINVRKTGKGDSSVTAVQKSVETAGSMAKGLTGAAVHGIAALVKRRKEKKEAEQGEREMQYSQPEKKEPGKPGRPKSKRENSQQVNVGDVAADERRKISGGQERRKLVPSAKRLPPASKKIASSGGVSYQAPPASDREAGMSLGQRSRRNPELKKRLIAQRNENYSDWKTIFLLESGLILEVGTENNEKKKKVIDVMRGKNKIEMNPSISEDHKEIASGKKKDDEGYMANVELDQMERAIKSLRKKLKRSDTQLPAWVQSKITRAADYIDTASEYMQSDEGLSEEVDKKKLLVMLMLKAADNAKKRKNSQLINGIIGEEVEISEAKKSEMNCNKPKAQAHGSGETGKSHVVKACEGGKEKLIRFGQLGVKGSPKKEGESEEYASRRNRFKTRHAKNIAKGKMSAAYWANKVKW